MQNMLTVVAVDGIIVAVSEETGRGLNREADVYQHCWKNDYFIY